MKEARATKRALEHAYSLYGAKLYSFAYYSTYSQEDAQDLAQEAFLRYAQALSKGTQVENPQAYLYRTVRNLSINLARERGREIGEGDYPIDIVEENNLYVDPERAALLQGQRQQVLAATLSLTEEQRTALILKEIDGLGYEEIAEVLDSNSNAVGALLSRGRLRFREAFRMGQINKNGLEEECQAYLPMLSQHIDGKLSENEENLLRQHLNSCPLCHFALEEMQEAAVSYRALIPLLPVDRLGVAISKNIGNVTTTSATASSTTTTTTSTSYVGISLAWKVAIGVMAGLLVVGGTVGTIIMTRGEGTDDKNLTTPMTSEEQGKQVALVYLKDGNIDYCLIDEEGDISNGVLVDELRDIAYFNVGQDGNAVVYITEGQEHENEYPVETNHFYVFHLASGEVTEYEFDPGCPYISRIGLDSAGDIWVSSHVGTAAGEHISKFSVQNNEVIRSEFDLPEKGRFGGDLSGTGLVDVRPDGEELLITCHEYYPGGGSYEELYLVAESGELLRDYGYDLVSQDTEQVVPVGWVYEGQHFIGRRDVDGVGVANELYLIDEDCEVLSSFMIPEEDGSVVHYHWNEANCFLAYSTSKNRLVLVDTNTHEVVAQIDGSEIGNCRFIRPQEVRSFTRPEPVITKAEEQELSNTISLWFSYAMARGRKDYSEPDYHIFWNLLSSGSPLRSGWARNGPPSFTLFVSYKKDDMPMLSYNIESFDVKEDKAVATCSCRMAAVDDEMLGTYPERTITIEITFIKESGKWLIYEEK